MARVAKRKTKGFKQFNMFYEEIKESIMSIIFAKNVSLPVGDYAAFHQNRTSPFSTGVFLFQLFVN